MSMRKHTHVQGDIHRIFISGYEAKITTATCVWRIGIVLYRMSVIEESSPRPMA